MEAEYSADVDKIIEQAESLQATTVNIEDSNELSESSNKVTTIFDKIFSIMSDNSRRTTVQYYRLWMLYVISWLGNVFLYVQLAKIIKEKDSSSVSMAAYGILLISSISWFTYGFLLKNLPLLISGSIQMVGVILLLIFIPKYKNAKPVESSIKMKPKPIKEAAKMDEKEKEKEEEKKEEEEKEKVEEKEEEKEKV